MADQRIHHARRFLRTTLGLHGNAYLSRPRDYAGILHRFQRCGQVFAIQMLLRYGLRPRADLHHAASRIGLVHRQRADDRRTAPTQALVRRARTTMMHDCRTAWKQPVMWGGVEYVN